MYKIATIETYTQKAWEKDMPVKTETKLGKKDIPDKPNMKLGKRRRVLMEMSVVLAISLTITLLGTYWFGFRYACKITNQIHPTKQEESTGIPRSEGTNKEISVETGKADNIIALVTNLHKSNTNNSSALNGEDIDATSEFKNDTNYFQGSQNVFQKLHQVFSIVETDEDEGEERISVETGKVDKIIALITNLLKTNLKNSSEYDEADFDASSESDEADFDASSESKNGTKYFQTLQNSSFQEADQVFSFEIDNDEGKEGISVEAGKYDKIIALITDLLKSNPKNSSESDGADIDGTSESKNDTNYSQALQKSSMQEPGVFELMTFEIVNDEGEEETCVPIVYFASITLICLFFFTLNVCFYFMLLHRWHGKVYISEAL